MSKEKKRIAQKDIPTNYYGVPSDKEHHKMIHADLISRACKTCGAKENEECKKLKSGVHMGRVSRPLRHFALPIGAS